MTVVKPTMTARTLLRCASIAAALIPISLSGTPSGAVDDPARSVDRPHDDRVDVTDVGTERDRSAKRPEVTRWSGIASPAVELRPRRASDVIGFDVAPGGRSAFRIDVVVRMQDTAGDG